MVSVHMKLMWKGRGNERADGRNVDNDAGGLYVESVLRMEMRNGR